MSDNFLYSDTVCIAGWDGGEGGFLHTYIPGDQEGDRLVIHWRVHGTDGECLQKSLQYPALEIDKMGNEVGEPIYGPARDETNALYGMSSLLSFLGAVAEARDESSDNWTLFNSDVRDWAKTYSDELAMLADEINEEMFS